MISELQKVELFRKYPKYDHILQYAKNMTGGEFRLSKKLELSNSQLLYTVKKTPNLFRNEVKIGGEYYGRYLWYIAPSNRPIDASEFAIYSNQKELSCNPLLFSDARVQKLFDRNIDTYYSGKDGESLVFDLGNVQRIDSLCFTPRTDGNDIIMGEFYELFYWDKEWISLGCQKANSNKLDYKNVPANSLLLLHNHTKGVEERIFTYENGKQIWW